MNENLSPEQINERLKGYEDEIVKTGGLAGALEPDEAIPHEIHDETAEEIHHPFESPISEGEANEAVEITEIPDENNPTVNEAAKAVKRFEKKEGEEIDKLLEKINRMPN